MTATRRTLRMFVFFALAVSMSWLSYFAGWHSYAVWVAAERRVELPAQFAPITAEYTLVPLSATADDFTNGDRVDVYGRDITGTRQLLTTDALIVDAKVLPIAPGIKPKPIIFVMVDRERSIVFGEQCRFGDFEFRPTSVIGPPAYMHLLSRTASAPDQPPSTIRAAQP